MAGLEITMRWLRVHCLKITRPTVLSKYQEETETKDILCSAYAQGLWHSACPKPGYWCFLHHAAQCIQFVIRRNFSWHCCRKSEETEKLNISDLVMETWSKDVYSTELSPRTHKVRRYKCKPRTLVLMDRLLDLSSAHL